jgi:hypothetical protein
LNEDGIIRRRKHRTIAFVLDLADCCSLPDHMIWTAMFFGHRQKSELKLNSISCRFLLNSVADLSNCRNPSDVQSLFDGAEAWQKDLLHEKMNAYKVSRCSTPACQPQYSPLTADHPLPLSTLPAHGSSSVHGSLLL